MSEQWPYQKLTLEQAAQVKPVLAHDAVGNEVREGDVRGWSMSEIFYDYTTIPNGVAARHVESGIQGGGLTKQKALEALCHALAAELSIERHKQRRIMEKLKSAGAEVANNEQN